MYRATEYAKKKPTHIRWKNPKGEYMGWIALGADNPKENQAAYRYAHDIGLTKWVEKAAAPKPADKEK